MAVTDTSAPLPGIERRQRADAARNREALLEAASQLFRERGLEVGVSEIAERAGVGRATLFRNFPTKADLVLAIIVERMRQAVADGRALREAGEPRGELLASLMRAFAEGQRLDRALFEGVADEAWLEHPEIQACHREMVEVIDALIAADHEAGTVRGDIGALDVLMLTKGACAVAAELHGDEGCVALARQLSLIRSAISASVEAVCPLQGPPLTLEEFVQARGGCLEPARRA